MPSPIGLVGNNRKKEEDNNYNIDFSFLATSLNEDNLEKTSFEGLKRVCDNDAEDVMKIWLKAEKVSYDIYKLNKDVNISNDVLLRLKARGLVVGGTEEIKFTSKAKDIISIMCLGERNNYLSKKINKSYTEILASMDKKGKKGFRIA